MKTRASDNQSQTRKKLLDFCQNRRILIVGNGGNLLQTKNGQLIDEFDIIVRMNHGYPRNHLVQFSGKRTDIWVCAYNHRPTQPTEYRLFNPQFALRLNNDTHIHPGMQKTFLTWDFDNLQQLRNLVKVAKPSTGLTTIYFFLFYLDLPEVTITGFDFFETQNYYRRQRGNNSRASLWHDPAAEKQCISSWIAKGRVKQLI